MTKNTPEHYAALDAARTQGDWANYSNKRSAKIYMNVQSCVQLPRIEYLNDGYIYVAGQKRNSEAKAIAALPDLFADHAEVCAENERLRGLLGECSMLLARATEIMPDYTKTQSGFYTIKHLNELKLQCLEALDKARNITGSK